MMVELHHAALSTPDLERLVAFYRDHFGFAPAFDFASFLADPAPQATVEVCYGRDPDGNLFELIEFFDHDVEAAGAR